MRLPRGLVWGLTAGALAGAYVTLHLALEGAIRVEVGGVVIRATDALRAGIVSAILFAAAMLVDWPRRRRAPVVRAASAAADARHALGVRDRNRSSTDPAELIDPTDPSDPSDPNQLAEHAEHADRVDGADRTDLAGGRDSGALSALGGLAVAATPRTVTDRATRLWSWTFAAAALAIVLALGLWCVLTVSDRVPEPFNFGDGALTELYTLHASRGIWGLGPYSRFGWHHPGSLYFYLLAPFYAAAGQHALGMTAGATAITMLSLVAIAGALFRHAQRAAAAMVFGGVAIYVYRLPRLLTSVWNPHILLLPYAALIIIGAVAASGRLAWLPLVTLLASFIAQTHVGLAPSALALAACTAAAGVWNAPRGRTWRWLGLSALTLAIVWFPSFYQQATERPGNLSQLLAFFLHNTGADPRISFHDAFIVWVGTMLAPLTMSFRLPLGSVLPPMIEAPPLAALVIAEVLLLWIAGAWAARHRLLVEAWLCRLSALAAVAGLLALSRIRGGLADHITFWNTIGGLLAATVLAAMAVLWIASFAGRTFDRADRLRRRGRLDRADREDDADRANGRNRADRAERAPRLVARLAGALGALAPAAAVIVILIAAIVAGREIQSHRDSLIAREGTPPVGRLYQATRAAIAKARMARPRVELRGEWSDASGILLQLYKRHVPLGIEPGAAWMFGAPLAARGDEAGTVIIARGDDGRAVAAEPGDCLIAWSHQTSVHLRPPTPAQYENLACLSYDVEAAR